MSITLAFEGAKVELSQTPGILQKLRLCGLYTRIIAQELFGTIKLIPYGAKALYIYQSLPSSSFRQRKRAPICLEKMQRYGDAKRCCADIYIPSEIGKQNSKHTKQIQGDNNNKYPVAVFCHGGIWAIGESWQFSPMASRLAEEGILTYVLNYSLYPKAKSPQMAEEVSDAITWAMKDSETRRGNSNRTTIIGHSAGAQLCMMALIKRAQKIGSLKMSESLSQDDRKHSMPSAFLGMAGVYNIAQHYEYEKGRGVAFLSTMERAIGGQSNFKNQSPLEYLLAANNIDEESLHPKLKNLARSDLKLRGKNARESFVSEGIISGSMQNMATDKNSGFRSVKEVKHISKNLGANLDWVQNLPPCNFMSSKEDVTVPWIQSEMMFKALNENGARAEHKCYSRISHADFAIGWKARRQMPIEKAPVYIKDLMQIIKSTV